MRSTLAWLWIALGALDRADASIDEGLRVADRVGADHPAFYLGAVLAALRVKQGRVDEARRRLDALLERAAARGERRIYGYALFFRASLDDDDGDDGLARIRAGIEALRPFASTHLLGTAHLARRLARRGDLGEATALARDGLARLRASGSALDDAFFGWAVFVDVLDQAGAADEADLAVAEALARLARLHAEIEEPALRRSFLAVDAVARLLARARGRGIAIPAALDPAIV